MSTKFILFIIQICLIYCSSDDPVENSKFWTVQSLYKHLNETYLHRKNPNYEKNLKYMIFDPENYLQYGEMQEAYDAMYNLSEKYNVSSHVFFISHLKDNNMKSDTEYASFVDELSYLIYKDHEKSNDNLVLTAVFFIKDRKMRIRTSKELRKIITDDIALNILNRRIKDLKQYNFQEVANGLMRDVYKEYTRDRSNLFTYLIILLFIITVLIVILLIYNQTKSSPQEDKVTAFLDKLKLRENPKEIFAESCIICLEDFKQNDKKNLEEKDEISILECGHKFHRNCITDWLKKDESCPLCRTKFNIKGNDNKSYSAQINYNNYIFNTILSEIIRIQTNTNRLNQREVVRIRRVYDSNYREPESSYRSSSSSSHSKSFSSYNRGSGGATSGW
jgi:uncharacterized membrane protein YgcG